MASISKEILYLDQDQQVQLQDYEIIFPQLDGLTLKINYPKDYGFTQQKVKALDSTRNIYTFYRQGIIYPFRQSQLFSDYQMELTETQIQEWQRHSFCLDITEKGRLTLVSYNPVDVFKINGIVTPIQEKPAGAFHTIKNYGWQVNSNHERKLIFIPRKIKEFNSISVRFADQIPSDQFIAHHPLVINILSLGIVRRQYAPS